MKILKYIVILCICVMPLIWGSCMDDLGNNTYDYERVATMVLDTASIDKNIQYVSTWNVGATIHFTPRIEYPFPEHLTFCWLIFDQQYGPVQNGNSEVYPSADTISRTLELEYVIEEKRAGKYWQLWLTARDTVSGINNAWQIIYPLNVAELDFVGGIYCLQEKDGRTDIDILGTKMASLTPVFSLTRDYWTQRHPDEPLEGKPRLIYYESLATCGQGVYIFTDETGMRCYKAGLTKMDAWEDMFYSAPAYNPQAIISLNKCDFLINDGKLHCLYTSKTGDRKFPAPVAGDYQLEPYLSALTKGRRGGAINAHQVVFDKVANGFRALYEGGTSLASFRTAATDAPFDVNRMEGECLYVSSTGSNDMIGLNAPETIAVMKRNGEYWLDVASFCNVQDDGYLAKRSINLQEKCPDIDKADFFFAGTAGTVLYYSVGSKLYAWGYTTNDVAHVLWEGDTGEEITCAMELKGGFPWNGAVLYFAIWNRSTQKGRIVEIEVNLVTGKKKLEWLMMRGGAQENPVIYDGFGKIASMTAIVM